MINRIVNQPAVPVNGSEQNMFTQELVRKRQNSFIDILQDNMIPDEVSFSAHALSRLHQRNIVVNDQIKANLENAIDKIAIKGGRESLIMLDEVVYLVSIPNKKVITALEASDENVFTNIDSALLMTN